MSENLKIEQGQEHIENHKAYVQSWIKEIKEKPETLTRAISEAEKVTTFMEYHVGLIPQNEYEKVMNSSMEIEKPQPIPKKSLIARGPKL